MPLTEASWVALLVQSIASAGLVLVAVVTVGLPLLLSIRKKAGAAATSAGAAAADAKAAREQVQNSHETNFRDDHDEKHTAVMSAIAGVESRMDARFTNLEGDIRGVRRDIGRLADADARHENRIHELEQTQPRTSPPQTRRGGNRRSKQ